MEEEAARAATTEGKLEYVDNKFAMFTARTGSNPDPNPNPNPNPDPNPNPSPSPSPSPSPGPSPNPSPTLTQARTGSAMAVDGDQVLWLPISPYISLYLPISPYISLYLPISRPGALALRREARHPARQAEPSPPHPLTPTADPNR